MEQGDLPQRLETWVSRERLFELVWAEPMTKVAERLGVSSSYLARVCTSLNVPRPQRGYWAKLEVGKAPPKPSLPAHRPGEHTGWVQGSTINAPLVWSDSDARSLANGESNEHTATGVHSLIEGIEPLFNAGRETHQVKFLKPSKRNLPDIQVSRSGLPAALAFANALFNAFERRGHRVVLASNDARMSRPEIDIRDVPSKQPFHEDLWHPGRQTVAYLGDIPVGLIIYEVAEATLMRYAGNSVYVRESEVKAGKFGRKYDRNWTSTHYLPTRLFCLIAYSSHYGSKWSNTWKETSLGKFQRQAVSLVKELEAFKPAAQAARDQGKLDYDRRMLEHEEHTRRRAEEAIVKRKAAETQESLAALVTFIEAVERTDRFNRAFQMIREMASSLDKGAVEAIETKIEIARRMLEQAPKIETFLNWRPPSD